MRPAETVSEAGRGARVQDGGGALVPSPISLEIPSPPSVNTIWKRSARGIVRSRAYQDWLSHAGWKLRAQKPGQVHGPVMIVVSVERGQRDAHSDIDNRIKAIFDLLVAQHVIDDDRHVVGFCASWAPGGNHLARILILPAADVAVDFHVAANGASGGWFIRPTTTEDINHAVAL